MSRADRAVNVLFVLLSAALILLLNLLLYQSQQNQYMRLWFAENYGVFSYILEPSIVYATSGGVAGGVILWLVRMRNRRPAKATTLNIPQPPRVKAPKPKSTLRRLASYVRPHWPYALAVGITMIASSALDLAGPWIMGFLLFDGVIKGQNLNLLPWVLFLIGGTFFAGQLTKFFRDFLTESLSQRTLHKLRYDVYQHLERLPMSFIDHSRTGELVSRVLSDTDEVEKVMTTDLTNLGADLAMVVGSASLLFYVGPSLAVVVLPVVLALVLLVNLFKRRVKRSSRRIREAIADLAAKAYEVITGIRIVKSFSREDHEAKEFHNRSLAILRSKVRLARLSSLYGSSVDFMTTLALLVILAITVPSVVVGSLTVGALIVFLGYLDKMFKPLVSLSKANFKFQKAMAAGDRVFEIMDSNPEILDAPGAIAPKTLAGRVEFDEVSFEYEPGRKVLEDFSLVIPAGETVALVGPSGAGKSTIVNLLLRFYEPTSGRVMFDSYLIKELKLNTLRENVGLVLQEPVLFSGSVRDNIAYGNPNASDGDVILAAKAANAHSFIENLPEGYETQLGERGVNLSVGQRQRIAIARALLKNPRVLVLDEATSNIDSESEVLIQEAMRRLARGRTTIVIAHRLSTIMDADRIVVLADGRIVEVGTHDTLLSTHGAYSRLYDAQLKLQITVPSQPSSRYEPEGGEEEEDA